MGHADHNVDCAAPTDYAFDYVTDYRNLPRWVLGLNQFDPLGEQTKGVGATFEGAVDLGPITLPVRMEFTEWREDRTFAARFTGSAAGTLTVAFEQLDVERTRLTVALDYSAGKGISGRLLEKAIGAFIGPSFRYMDHHLPSQIEAGYAEVSKK
ncbi:Polyketide cyclase / dehydrase and lipid transport [Mycobacteroides abscessus subsp. abscessus]|nr:Polyketide cyclase / dehydrase and lipid transport [Mycobacteroides abscessus subsp. abscessus]